MILGSHGDPPLFFKWTVDDKLLVDLSGAFHPIGVFKKKADRVAIKVLGLQPGKTRLFLNVTVPGLSADKQNIESVMLSAYLDIEVIMKLRLEYPDFPVKKLNMAPFSQIQLRTNLDTAGHKIVYCIPKLPGKQVPSTEVLADKSVTSDIIVTVSPTGLLQAHGTIGYALLIIIATDELGLKQKVSMVVNVKPIYYMNLNVIANWRIHSDSPLRAVPLGTEFILKASFHDDLGNKFHAGPTELMVKTSRCDLIKVEDIGDASVKVYTKKPGNTMLKAWAEGIEKTTDYVRINVEQAVRPILDHLTTGDIVCLFTPVVSEYNAPGTWRSSDSSLVTINPALDIAFVGNKEGVVSLTHSFLLSAPIQVQIYPVSIIEWMEDPFLLLTNGQIHKVERVVLVLQSEKSVGTKTNNLIQGWRCRTDVRKLISPGGFKCFMKFSNESVSINIEQVFNITSSWVPDTGIGFYGQYACKFVNLGVNGSEIATLHTNVTLWATTDDFETESAHLNIKFLPQFHVPLEIILDETTNTGDLVVIGHPEVLSVIEVTPADSSIVYVDSGKQVNETAITYNIQLVDYHWRLAELEDAMGIIVSCLRPVQSVMIESNIGRTLLVELLFFFNSWPYLCFDVDYLADFNGVCFAAYSHRYFINAFEWSIPGKLCQYRRISPSDQFRTAILAVLLWLNLLELHASRCECKRKSRSIYDDQFCRKSTNFRSSLCS
ncbi:hypothetical protein NQ317_010693 [Molorchus minor]|uniref:Uncharacterized protein n=1 Tax=Molorchus minor TaxID=1323400 RepID=A0ABQ9K5N9_9CUCU|nr:hypothetical protein NQ317_010693 [Molorchus minor]